MVGDRAREQLLDRPIDHADDHEHHRPQDVEVRIRRRRLAVVVEQVTREREVGERQDAGRGDPDREHARAARVRPAARRAVGPARGAGSRATEDDAAIRRRHTGSVRRGSTIVQGNGARVSITSPLRAQSAAIAWAEKWLTWPGVLPSWRQ